MKIKKYTIVCYILALAMLLPLSSMAITPDKEQFKSPDYAETYIDGLGDSQLELEYDYVQKEKLNIIVRDKRTGKEWQTNPVFNEPHNTGSTEERVKAEKSQLVLEYSFDKNATAKNLEEIGYVMTATSIEQYYSFTESIQKDQIDIQEIKDENGKLIGLRVNYGFGDVKPVLFPKIFLKERMDVYLARLVDENGEPDEAAQKKLLSLYKLVNIEERQKEMQEILDKTIDEKKKAEREKAFKKEIEEYLEKYPILATGASCYIIYGNAIESAFKVIQTLETWQKVGYTREDLELDYELTNYVDTAATFSFEIPVEYKIEGNTFKVEVLFDQIVYPPNIAITRIDVLPYFGACDKTVEDGYIFVPDGSGAIIKMNKKDKRITGMTMQLLNRSKDEALSRLNFADIREIPYFESAIMPVFGMKQEENVVMCIIEKGYELTNISAYIPNDLSRYNYTYASIYPVYRDQIYYSSGSTSGIMKYPQVEVTVPRKVIDPKTKKEKIRNEARDYCRFPDTSFVLRYNFLQGDQANYSGMANYFRNYLIKSHNLVKVEAKDNIPFYADLYGVIDKKVPVLGFPINKKYALTTFDEAEIIANALFEKGIKNLSLRYIGMVNGGMVASYSDDFNVESVIGGEKGYKDFLASMKELGVDVIPEIDINHVYKDKLFEGFAPSKDAVTTLGKTQAVISDMNVATGLKDSFNDSEYYHPRWAISPKKYPDLFSKLKQKLDKYDNKKISFGTIGSTMTSDYNEKLIIDRTQTSRVIANELKKYKDNGYDVTVDKGFYYTIPYVSTILDIPMTSSYFRIEDHMVPFVQLVLHGLIEYAGEPFNMNQDMQYQVLKCLEYGANVYGRFMYKEDMVLHNTYFMNLFSLHYSNWLEEANIIYNTVNDVISDVQDQYMVNHEMLAEDVYMTTYENGMQIIVNYGDTDFVSENFGVKVGVYDFKVVKEGK